MTNPAEPALPKDIVDVTATNDNLVLRGVGFRGGTYTDTPNVLPLTGAPTTELRGVHAPFVSPVFYPMRMWTSNYFGEFDSGGTNLIVTPVQHRFDPANAQRSIRRVFSNLNLRLFYADAPTLLGGAHADAALADAPTIVDAHATPDGSDIVFSARVVGDPSAAIHEVWVVYTNGGGTWAPLDLQQCTAPLPASCAGLDDSRVWTGRLAGAPASGPVRRAGRERNRARELRRQPRPVLPRLDDAGARRDGDLDDARRPGPDERDVRPERERHRAAEGGREPPSQASPCSSRSAGPLRSA